jgi:hypothetical protein
MAATERIRIEIAFDGQQVLSVLVPFEAAEELDRRLGASGDGSFSFDAEDGRSRYRASST